MALHALDRHPRASTVNGTRVSRSAGIMGIIATLYESATECKQPGAMAGLFGLKGA